MGGPGVGLGGPPAGGSGAYHPGTAPSSQKPFPPKFLELKMAVTTDVLHCPGCGASIALVGRVHLCGGSLIRETFPELSVTHAPDTVTHTEALRTDVTHNAGRQRRFRVQHGEEYRRQNRERILDRI